MEGEKTSRVDSKVKKDLRRETTGTRDPCDESRPSRGGSDVTSGD